METRIEKFRKEQMTEAEAQQVADDHKRFGGALRSDVSGDDTFWIVTTVLKPVAADDNAQAAAATPAAAATAAGAGAAVGAVAAGIVGAVVGAATGAALAVATGGSAAVNLDAAVIPRNRRPVAKQIVEAFAAGGFGPDHQAAALANAIQESSLNPAATVVNGTESSFGLFQLNTKGGLGAGHDPLQLIKSDVNIAIILAAAKQARTFRHAASLVTAVAAFVREIERPADADRAISKRLTVAMALVA